MVTGYPGTRVHLTTPPLEREKGSKQCMVTRVLGYPGTQIPVSVSSAAAQALKGEQIVCGNPGTRVPGYPGTRVFRGPGTRFRFRLNRPPPGRVPGSKF